MSVCQSISQIGRSRNHTSIARLDCWVTSSVLADSYPILALSLSRILVTFQDPHERGVQVPERGVLAAGLRIGRLQSRSGTAKVRDRTPSPTTTRIGSRHHFGGSTVTAMISGAVSSDPLTNSID